jgi:hypothetical protein
MDRKAVPVVVQLHLWSAPTILTRSVRRVFLTCNRADVDGLSCPGKVLGRYLLRLS